MTERVPLMLGVHFEPDQDRDVGHSGPVTWSGAEAMIARVTHLRSGLERATGGPVRIGWYVRMDRQIAAIAGAIDAVGQRFGDAMRRLVRDGDYTGLHTHATTWDASTSRWVLNDDPTVWADEVRAGIASFPDALGEPLLRNYSSRSFLSDETAALLAQSGVRVDLTLEEPVGGNYFKGPRREPRHIQASNDGSTMLVLPASTGHPHGGSLPTRAARRARHGPFTRWYLHPWRAQQSPNDFWDELKRSWRGMDRPYAAFSFRSSAEGGRTDRRQREVLEALLDHPIRHSLRFADPLELCDS